MSAISRRSGNTVTRVTIVAAMAALVIAGPAGAAEQFEEADIRLEQNVADKDVEVNFDVKTHSAGIASLQVMAPDGRMVIDFKSPRSKFGMRYLSFETPEPPNDGRIQADFPAGAYRFIGTTTAGERVEAIATLHHALPPAPQVASPSAGQENVPIIGVKVRWKPMPEAAAFVVVMEDENSGRSIKADLAGKATEFSVPDGFLKFGGEYKAEVGAVAKNGNRTFVEHEFSTAKGP